MTFHPGDTGRTRDGREYIVLEVCGAFLWAAVKGRNGWTAYTFDILNGARSPRRQSHLDLLPPSRSE